MILKLHKSFSIFIAALLIFAFAFSCGKKNNICKINDKAEFAKIAYMTENIINDSAISFKKLKDLKDELNEIISEADKLFPGKLGVSLMDIKNVLECGVRESETFEAASVIKIPIMFEVFRQAGDKSLKLSDMIKINNDDIVQGSGVVKNEPPGTEFSINDLIGLMIVKSDNTATDVLIKKVGMENVNKTMERIGLSSTELKRLIFDFNAIDRGYDNITTPDDMKKLLLYIHNTSEKDVNSQQMLDILKGQERHDLIPALLPKDIVIAHKTGELTGVLLDAAIVFLKERTYILCLFGKNIINQESAKESFAKLSKKIYDIFGRSNKKSGSD